MIFNLNYIIYWVNFVVLNKYNIYTKKDKIIHIIQLFDVLTTLKRYMHV